MENLAINKKNLPQKNSANNLIGIREKTLILGWILAVFGLPFRYITITQIAGSSLTVTLFTSMLGTWLIIFSLLPTFRSKTKESILLFLIFFLLVFFNLFFWIKYGLVPQSEILKNITITFSYLVLLMTFKNSCISNTVGFYFQKSYFIFLCLNTFFGLTQYIMSRFGIYLTFFWQKLGLRGDYFRLQGLMREPSHLGLIFIGLLFLPLEKKSEKFFALLSIFVLLLSFSTVSWVVAFFIFIKYIYRTKKKGLITILILTCLFLYILSTPGIQRILSSLYLSDSSSFTRVAKGFFVFSDFSFSERITGIGPGYTEIYSLIYSGNLFSRVVSEDYFVNGFSSELINFGFIAAIILNLFYYSIFGKKYFLLFLVFTLLRFGTSINNSSNFLIIVLLVIVLQKQNQFNNRYK